MTKPITPNAAAKSKISSIPQEVIESFNEFLGERFNGKDEVTIKQDEVVKKILTKLKLKDDKITRHDIFENGWLDIETIFGKEGWKVTYTKGAYYETFEPYFDFVPKRLKSKKLSL